MASISVRITKVSFMSLTDLSKSCPEVLIKLESEEKIFGDANFSRGVTIVAATFFGRIQSTATPNSSVTDTDPYHSPISCL